jgi:RecB family exonuclease
MELPLLTASRLSCYRRCPYQHHLRYDLRLTRDREATPLRFGRAFHLGMETRARTGDVNAAYAAATAGYRADVPAWADATEWAVEREQVARLVEAHPAGMQFAAIEQQFRAKLPGSRLWQLAGKIDGIVRLEDGRLAVLEYKTTGEDIAPDSDYWRRLAADQQISLYMLGARASGFDVATVVYDVTRKPLLRLKQTEQVEDYSARLAADIAGRPEWYYARREIPRLDNDLERTVDEVLQQARAMRAAARNGWHYRNVGKLSCDYCDFANPCLQNLTIDPNSPPPGYVVRTSAHPELEEGAV